MGIFSLITSGFDATTILILLCAWIISITVALCAHEFSHALVAVKMGDNTPKMAGRLTLNPAAHFDGIGFLMMLLLGFGWAKPVPIQSTNFRNIKKGEILVSLSGVLTNLALCIICTFLHVLFLNVLDSSIVICEFIITLFLYSAMINFFFALFNILPIPPLDGFNFVAAFCKYENKFIVFMRQNGFIIMLILLAIIMFTDVFSIIANLFIGCLINLFSLIF